MSLQDENLACAKAWMSRSNDCSSYQYMVERLQFALQPRLGTPLCPFQEFMALDAPALLTFTSNHDFVNCSHYDAPEHQSYIGSVYLFTPMANLSWNQVKIGMSTNQLFLHVITKSHHLHLKVDFLLVPTIHKGSLQNICSIYLFSLITRDSQELVDR